MKETNHQAFLNWYKGFHDPFVRYCAGLAFGIIEAEDLVQDAVLVTLEEFERVKDKDKLASYMFGVVHNIVKNKRRRLKFKGNWDDSMLEKLADKAPSPEIAADINILLKAMDKLAIKEKSSLVLFEISGYSIKEIASLSHESEAAIKTRLHRTRKKLKSILTEKETAKLSVQERMAMFSSILF